VTARRQRAPQWMQDGTATLLSAVDALPDDHLDAPTALPGWSRRHLLAHIGFNAEALRRLAAWARTGTPTPMYASSEQRSAEIEQGVTWPADRLRAFLKDSAAALADDLDALSPEQWQSEVVTAQGRTVPASEIPWMRTREVAVHAVDLDAGVRFDDLPADLCEALLDDVAALRSTRDEGPALRLVALGGRSWTVAGSGEPITLEGPLCDLARWLTGRGAGGLVGAEDRAVPELGRWL
jgi:maleylpyruvate isomerase